MISQEAATQVQNSSELANKIRFFLDSKRHKDVAKLSTNARNFVDNRIKVLDNYISEIDKFIK